MQMYATLGINIPVYVVYIRVLYCIMCEFVAPKCAVCHIQ